MSSILLDDPLQAHVDAFLSATERILDQFKARAAARSAESSTIPAQVIFQECCTDGFLQLVQLLGSLRNELHSSNATWTIRGFESIDSCCATPRNHSNTDDVDDPSLCPECYVFDSITSRRTTAGHANINGANCMNGDSSSQCLLTLLPTSTLSEHDMQPCYPQRIPCDKGQWSFLDYKPIDFTESLSLSHRDRKMATNAGGGGTHAVSLKELVEHACSIYHHNGSITAVPGGARYSVVSPLLSPHQGQRTRENCPSAAVIMSANASLNDSRHSARLRAMGRAGATHQSIKEIPMLKGDDNL